MQSKSFLRLMFVRTALTTETGSFGDIQSPSRDFRALHPCAHKEEAPPSLHPGCFLRLAYDPCAATRPTGNGVICILTAAFVETVIRHPSALPPEKF